MKSIRIATRKSPLALAQIQNAISLIRDHFPETEVTILPLSSEGDNDLRPLQQLSGIGIFVKTLEKALLNNEADCALHCLKDLPAPVTDGLVLPSYLPREEVNDVLLCLQAKWEAMSDQEVLSKITKIATGSLRRQIFLAKHYPQWKFLDLRGNVNTRLQKLVCQQEGIEGIILAQVGIRRLYTHYRKAEINDWDSLKDREVFLAHYNKLRLIPIPTTILLPAPGQGVLVFQCRAQDTDTISFLRTFNNTITEKMSIFEREVMMRVEGGCRTPLGVWAQEIIPGKISIDGAMESGGRIRTLSIEYTEEQAGTFQSNNVSLIKLAQRIGDKLKNS